MGCSVPLWYVMDSNELYEQLVKIKLKVKPTSHRQLEVRKKKQKIVNIVRQNSKFGVSHSELADILNIDRKNLRHYTKELINEGIIIRGEGKQGKYYPADKEHRGPVMDADILGLGAAGLVLQKNEIPLDTPFVKPVEGDTGLQHALFEFSNKVGAIVTYLLIQAMNPENRITDDSKSSKEKDLDIRYWVDSATSSLQQFLLPIFQNMLISYLLDFECLLNDFKNKDGSIDQNKVALYTIQFEHRQPFYILDNRMISELMSELHKIYPSIISELENVKAMVPKAVAKQLADAQQKSLRSKTQKRTQQKNNSASSFH
ncbi:MAG TPA: winged helix-turn-helix domain-containing protein [Nitrososphaeraceae archaeon]|nr:winged helix-turn-helix domain-containing protein [Nitrososphaeraceae archaeon]